MFVWLHDLGWLAKIRNDIVLQGNRCFSKNVRGAGQQPWRYIAEWYMIAYKGKTIIANFFMAGSY